MAKKIKPRLPRSLPLQFGDDPPDARQFPPGTPQEESTESDTEEHYEVDAEDGLSREVVGPWVRDKHARLKRYVDISSAVRRKWLEKPNSAGATYIELLSGPGRIRVRGESVGIDGSPLVAWRESQRKRSEFSQIWVADKDSELVGAAESRLKKIGAPVRSQVGPAVDTVDKVVSQLNPHALHFAFLDPFSLRALPFQVVRKLATLEHMDILIHFSSMDLTRNLRLYINDPNSPLDLFAPGWREAVTDFACSDEQIRGQIFKHWRDLLADGGMSTAEAAEDITSPGGQRLYWLAFAARHPRALEFWEKIRRLQPFTGSLLSAG